MAWLVGDEEMKENRLHRWVVLVIAGVYLLLLGGTVRAFRQEAFPKPSLYTLMNGVWAQQLEDYLSEHIGFHDTLFRVKSQADQLLGEKMIRGVYVTDEMLLEKVTANSALSPEDLAAPVNRFYETTQMPTFLVLVPSASEIYKTQLPANAPNADQKNRIQAVYAATTTGVRSVDTCNVLSSLKSNYIFYRTDSRWTSFGAYYVYQSVIQKMGFSFLPYDRYVISHLSTDFKGDLYERTLYEGVRADVLDCYTLEGGARITGVTAWYPDGSSEDRGRSLYSMAALETADMYRFYLGTPCERLVIRTNLDNGKKLLLFQDDYGDCMVPFLMQHYSEICIVNLGMTQELPAEVKPEEYTQALFLCSMKNWESLAEAFRND